MRRKNLFFLLIAAVSLLAIGSLFLILRPAEHVSPPIIADLVYVDKSERRLELQRDGAIIKVYQIALGKNPVDPKRQEGDKRTPEGKYVIDYRNESSLFHLSLHISYPNEKDLEESKKLGVSPGGDIFIHGLSNFWPLSQAPKIDWTLGCIAVNNDEIEEIWALVPNGTPIEIVP